LEKELLKITTCIEATIPFRSQAEIEDIVRLAVVLANKDIENFSVLDAGLFLDNTWKLLPETNMSLRFKAAYSIKE